MYKEYNSMTKGFFIKTCILTVVVLINIYPSACFSFYPPVTSNSPPLPPVKHEVNFNEYINKLTCLENDMTTLQSNREYAKILKSEANKIEKSSREGYILLPSELHIKLIYMSNNCNFEQLKANRV